MEPFPNPVQSYYFFLTYANIFAFFCIFIAFFCISTQMTVTQDLARTHPRPRKNPPICLGRRATRALLPRCVVVIDAHIRGGIVGCNPCGTPTPNGVPHHHYCMSYFKKKVHFFKKSSLSLAYTENKHYLCTEFLTIATMSEKTKIIIKVVVSVLIAALTALAASLGLTSCNVTRTVTNESSYVQRGDTNVVIHTKTIETYDATKKR